VVGPYKPRRYSIATLSPSASAPADDVPDVAVLDGDRADSPSASAAIILPACPRRTPPKPDEEREKEAHRLQAAKLGACSIIRKRGQYLGTVEGMRRQPKPLPWRSLVSATNSVGGSWCRSGTSVVARHE
jgi:hypothetical protein